MNIYTLILIILLVCLLTNNFIVNLFLVGVIFILLFYWYNNSENMQSYHQLPAYPTLEEGCEQKEGFIYYPFDKIVDNNKDFIAKINHEKPKPLETICMKETPKDLDNTDSIAEIYDNHRDLNDQLVAEIQGIQKNIQKGKDRNIRSNQDVYNTWWSDELKQQEERTWYEKDQTDFLSESIGDQKYLDNWLTTGYMY